MLANNLLAVGEIFILSHHLPHFYGGANHGTKVVGFIKLQIPAGKATPAHQLVLH